MLRVLAGRGQPLEMPQLCRSLAVYGDAKPVTGRRPLQTLVIMKLLS
jgi:hypothetical protein